MSVNIRGWSSLSSKLTKALSSDAQAKVMHRAAQRSRNELIRLTPKKWTGQTRRGWRTHVNVGQGIAVVKNDNKVMLYLEKGTKAYTAKAGKLLFIPLTRRAAQAGARGVIAANNAVRSQGRTSRGAARALPFRIGRDFVWAKRRKGIAPRNIVKNHRATAMLYMMEEMKHYLRSVIT